jgi:hypothetical protein
VSGKRYPAIVRSWVRDQRLTGRSVNSIAEELGSSPATITSWVKDIERHPDWIKLSRKFRVDSSLPQARAAKKIRQQQRESRWKEEALDFWQQHSSEQLFMSGIALYWGEGAKTKTLSLSNSDVKLAKFGCAG